MSSSISRHAVYLVGYTARQTRHGLLPLRLGLGLDEIAETFDFGEIEPAIEEGAARELTGLGETQTGQGGDAAEQCAHHGGRAVDLQLGGVLAGEGMRRRHPGDEAGVDELSIETERGESKAARLWPRYGEMV